MRARHEGRIGLALALALACVVAMPFGPPARATEPGTVRLMAVGDTFLAFNIGRRIVREGPHVPFARVADTFAQADLVIANLECALSRNGNPWPGDGEFRPRPKTSMRRMSAAAVSAGAALVIGHGSHNLQGYRAGDHTFIAYSLGNFSFPGYPAASNDTAILDVTLSAAGVESFAFIPVVINRRSGLPRLATGSEIERVLGRLKPI